MAEKRSPIAAWAQLLRLPNLFTVPGDAVAGAMLAAGTAAAPLAVAGAAGAVLLMYMSGLLLNDYFDRDEDARERPDRPIPAGEVPAVVVLLVGCVLLIAGVGIAFLLGLMAGYVSLGLAACVLAYDAGGRKIPALGPILMGGCRGGSILLGAAAVAAFTPGVWVAASAILWYTLAITLVAARETSTEAPGKVVLGPAALLCVLFFVGPAVVIPDIAQRALPGAAFLAAAYEATRAALPVLQGKKPVPPLIGRLIRVMLTIQAAWILTALHKEAVSVLLGVAAVFAVLRFSAEMAGRKFYGS